MATDMREFEQRNRLISPTRCKIVKACFSWSIPAGSKLWRWRYWADGKEKLMALGEYPHRTSR